MPGGRTAIAVAALLSGCVRAGFGGPGSQCDEQQLVILADADDGEIDHNGVLLPRGEAASTWKPHIDPDALYAGYWIDEETLTEGPTRTYLRFQLSAALPAGASINEATLTLHGLDAPVAHADWDATTHALRVRAEDAADAPAVTSGTIPSLLPTSVRWPAQGGLTWQVGAGNSVDVVPVLQALVDKKGGLSAGAHVQLWLWGEFSSVAAEVATPDIGRPGAVPAGLEISWCNQSAFTASLLSHRFPATFKEVTNEDLARDALRGAAPLGALPLLR